MISKLQTNGKGKSFHFNKAKWLILFILSIALLVNCASSKVVMDPSIQTKLKAMESSPDTMGTLIYEGAVFPLGDRSPKQVFSYERRVKEEKELVAATHITRDMGKNIIVTQRAMYLQKYQLKEFEYINGQVGYIAKAKIDGKMLRFTLTDNAGQVTNFEEEVNEPLAVGPTLFGLIVENWEEMSKGNSFFLRFVVAEQKQSYRFEVRKLSDNNGITQFEMKATNWLIGLFIAPFRFDYDSSKRTILTYQGRVPPMLLVDGKLKELDARVSYTHRAAYR